MASISPPHLLIIGYVWPEPNSSAAGSHMMQLIEEFQQRDYQITFASPARKSDTQVPLESLGISEVMIEVNDPAFDTFVLQLNPSVVIFDRYMMEEQFGWRVEKMCPNAVRILNTEDFHALRAARQHLIKHHDAQLKNKTTTDILCPKALLEAHCLYSTLAESELAKREVAALFRSDLNLMTSQFEIELLQNSFQLPASHLVHLPLSYPKDKMTHAKLSFNDRKHFIFIGNFRHDPNWDAVLQLKQLWPNIRNALKNTEFPDAQLHIYGAYPPKKAQQLHNEKQGFLIKGWAKDAFEVLGQARVCLAPIRFGAGIKGKLAESMICGTPSVTTPIGSESMLYEFSDWPGSIQNSVSDFCEAAVTLYQDAETWQSAHTVGLALFQAHYAAGKMPHFEQFFKRLTLALADIQSQRQQNFIGSMLNHHLLKSTQYMSQWIAEKNKNAHEEHQNVKTDKVI